MTTSWTLPAQEIINDALQLIGVVGTGQTASADDHAICLTALQNIIKELPIHGLSWPKITVTPATLAWSAGAPSKVSMPADYFGQPQVSYTVNGANVDLRIIPKAEYDALMQPDAKGNPRLLYIAPDNTGYLWPVPESDPALSLTYQAITTDVELASRPDVAQTWIGGLGLWLAYEICPKFAVDLATRQDIEKRYMMRRQLMLGYATETAPICFTVAD